jgi:type I restriction enzyme S subunit
MSKYPSWEEFLSEEVNGWQNSTMGALFSHRQEKNRPELPLLSVTRGGGVVDRSSLAKRDTSNADKSKYLRVEVGDIAYNTMRMWQGVSGSVHKEGIVSPAYTVLEPSKTIYSNFAKYLVKDELLIQIFHQKSQGLVDDTLNLKFANLSPIKVKTPPLPEQKKIASILTSVDEVIENTQKQIDKLQDLKKATMNELLTKGIGHTEFKDSELGQIPKSWKVIALAELLELKNGLNTNADAFGSGSPFLSYKDIYKDTELTERSLSQKVEVSERENNSFSVDYGDVFFTRTSETPEEIGFANVYLGANVGAVFNGFCIRGRPITNKLSVRLSRFLFRSDYVRVQMRFLCKYTTRAGISGESLNRCLLAVPPIDEQEKYLKTLNSIEKMVKAAGKKLSQTQSLKKSLMQDLLTGKVRVTVN